MPLSASNSDSVTTDELLFPFLDLGLQFQAIRDELTRAVLTTMATQQFILGPELKAFESEVATYLNVKAAIGCASGSDALLLSLFALGIGCGDEVITTPFTFVATAGAIARSGATPVFVDVQPETFNIDPRAIAAHVTARTRAIIPVHLFGLPADMNAILSVANSRAIAVIEDAAQAIGAQYCGVPIPSQGLLGCLSFFPSKNLGGAGDGGMVTTNDSPLAERIRLLRVHGSRTKYHYEIIGMNSRLDGLQAAILRVKFRYLQEWNTCRRRNAAAYCRLFREYNLDDIVTLPSESSDCTHVYNQFVIRCPDRDRLREFLRQRGIPTEVYYPQPLHLQPAFSHLGYKIGSLPISEMLSREVLALPIYPELSLDRQYAVVDSIASYLHKYRQV